MDALFTGFKRNFEKGLESVSTEYLSYSTVVPSNTSIETYPFLEKFGGMSEWLTDRQIKNVASKKLELKNRKFEDTVALRREDVEDDQYGIYAPVMQEMGFAAANLWGELAVEALYSGAVDTWIDDKTFFATDHAYGSNTINNKTTSALSSSTYAAARLAMLSYKGHNDRALKVLPNLLIVGPALEATAFDILQQELVIDSAATGGTTDYVGGAIRNRWRGTAKYIVLPELTGTYANYWFMCDVSRPLKPVVVQQRMMPKLTKKDNETDDNVFDEDVYKYGTRARGAAVLTMPHLIYGGIV